MKIAILVMSGILSLSSVLPAQTAKVITLSDKDSAEIKTLYAQQSAIEKKIADFRNNITKNYISQAVSSGVCQQNYSGYFFGAIHFSDNSERCYKIGWEHGFIYSDDFRFIVPQDAPKTSAGTCDSWVVPAFAGTNTIRAW
jgi:hypothetical protein